MVIEIVMQMKEWEIKSEMELRQTANEEEGLRQTDNQPRSGRF